MKVLQAVALVLVIAAAIPVLASLPRTFSHSDGFDEEARTSGSSDDFSGEDLFEFERLVGSTPNSPIRGVNSAGAPWTVARGEAELEADGELEVRVEGLVLTNTGNATLDGTTGPVTGVRASLTCEGSGVVATTGVVPLSSAGNAEIEEEISLPSSCFGPVVLIRIGSTASNPGPLMGPWIAVTGF